MLELRATHRCLEVREAKIMSRDLMPVVAQVTRHAMAAVELHETMQFWVARRHHAALAGSDRFRRMKAVGADHATDTSRASFIGGSQRLSRVFDQYDLARGGEFIQRVHVTHVAIRLDGYDRFRVRGPDAL